MVEGEWFIAFGEVLLKQGGIVTRVWF